MVKNFLLMFWRKHDCRNVITMHLLTQLKNPENLESSTAPPLEPR